MIPLLQRQSQVLDAIVETDDPDTAEALVHELVRAPRNRAELRAQLGALPRRVRRAAGWGAWRRGLFS